MPIDAEKMTKDLIDKGLLIEAGWVGFRYMAVHPDAGARQLVDMRCAFFAGAQHVFTSILTALDPGAEPTEQDLHRMAKIHSELDEYIKQFKVEHKLDG